VSTGRSRQGGGDSCTGRLGAGGVSPPAMAPLLVEACGRSAPGGAGGWGLGLKTLTHPTKRINIRRPSLHTTPSSNQAFQPVSIAAPHAPAALSRMADLSHPVFRRMPTAGACSSSS